MKRWLSFTTAVLFTGAILFPLYPIAESSAAQVAPVEQPLPESSTPPEFTCELVEQETIATFLLGIGFHLPNTYVCDAVYFTGTKIMWLSDRSRAPMWDGHPTWDGRMGGWRAGTHAVVQLADGLWISVRHADEEV